MMIDSVSLKTNFFDYVDSFKLKENVSSQCLFGKQIPGAVITIGIPTFKRSDTLKDALLSAINQDCNFSYQIIVLDNNPERDDETEKFMMYYSKIPNLLYYKNSQNLGMGGNWNRLVVLSETEWVSLLHDDDIISPTFLRDMMNVAIKYEADVINSSFYLWHEKDEIRPSFANDGVYKVIKSTVPANFLTHRAGMPTGIVYKRSVYIAEGGVNDDYYPSFDWVYHTRLSLKYHFILYEKPLTIYRFAVNTCTKKETIEKYTVIDIAFMHYLANFVNYPLWYSNLCIGLKARSFVKSLGYKKLFIFGKEYRAQSLISGLISAIIYKLDRYYYNKSNIIGMA